MSYKCDPNIFFGLPRDSIAVKRYFRHVLAAENMPVTDAYLRFQERLDSYMKENHIASEEIMGPGEWKNFSNLFAKANKLEKNSPIIALDVENIINKRHCSIIEELVLETKPKEMPEFEIPSMALLPVLFGNLYH